MKNRNLHLFSYGASIAIVALTFSSAQAGTTWDAGGGATTNIDTSSNWNDDINPLLTAGNQTLTFGTGGSTATINTAVNVSGLVINRDAAFTIANGAGNLTIGTGGITVTPGSSTARTHTISESNLILAGNQTWSVSNTGVGSGNMQLNVSSVISGNFGIIKTGSSGILKLTGNNSFTGGVTLREGFLNLGNANALGNGTLTIGDNTSSNSTAGVTVNLDDASLTYNNDITLVHNGQAQSRVVQSRVANTSLNGTITVSGLGNIIFSAGANQQLTINGKITGSTPGLSISLMNNGVGTVLLTNSANDFNSGVTNSLIVARGTLLLQGNDNADGTAGILGRGTGFLNMSASSSNTGEQARILTNGAFTIARAITMNQGGAGSASFNTLGGNTADTSTFSGNITMASGTNSSYRLTAATGGTVNFTGAITGTASNGLSKIGNGTVVLGGSGNNTYTGTTAISTGALIAAKSTALGSTADGTTVSSGAALQLSGGIVIGAEALSLTGDGISSGGALRNLSGNNSYAGAITLAGATRINSDSGTLTLGAGGITGAQNLSFGGAGDTAVTGVIGTGAGTLAKDGAGTLALSGNNTYNGTTTINAGTLLLVSGSSTPVLSSSSAIINNSTLAFNAPSVNVTYANEISGTGNVIHNQSVAGRRVTLSGNNSYSGGTFVSNNVMLSVTSDNNLGATSGALTLGNGTTGGVLRIDQTGFTSANRSIVLAGSATEANANKLAINVANGTAIFGGNISGSGNLDLTGSVYSGAPSGTGTVVFTLSGNNTYTGATSISNNVTVTAGSTTALGNSSAVSLQGTRSTLNLNNNNLTIGSLASSVSSNVTLGNRTLTIGGDNTNTTFAGVLAGSGGGLTKNGLGTFTLSNNNTYSGGTSVNAGALNVTSAGSLASGSAFTLGANGTADLANAGQTLGAVSNANSASNALNFSASSGTVTLASLSGAGNTRFGSNAVVTGGISTGTINAIGSLTANITGGTTTVGGVATIGTMSAGTANLNGATSSIATLSGGNIALGSTTVLSVSGGSSSGVISGGGSLTKAGAGTLTLSGNNTYTGTTTVSEGTLAVNGSLAGGVTVSANTTLQGSGTLGALTVSGQLAPGNSIESLGVSSASFLSGSTYAYELNSNVLGGDLLYTTGALSIATGTTLTLTELTSGTLAMNSKLTLISYGSWNDGLFTYNGSTLANNSKFFLGTNEWLFRYDDTEGGSNYLSDQAGAAGYITMTVVPEPNVAMVAGSLMLMALLRRRRD